jgi:hypothetical protein
MTAMTAMTASCVRAIAIVAAVLLGGLVGAAHPHGGALSPPARSSRGQS